jgi:hypothetical protein
MSAAPKIFNGHDRLLAIYKPISELPMKTASHRIILLRGLTLLIVLGVAILAGFARQDANASANTSLHPGQPWRDMAGEIINARGSVRWRNWHQTPVRPMTPSVISVPATSAWAAT